jgi:hypothetical protein
VDGLELMTARRRKKATVVASPPHKSRRVYVETSVWGMTLDDQPRALRQPTNEFLRQCALGLFVPSISTVVLEEIGLAPAAAAERMVRQINTLAPRILKVSDESEDLADAYLQAGIIPAKKRDDARHVAIATVAGLDIVVSWNHRHLANERRWALFNAVKDRGKRGHRGLFLNNNPRWPLFPLSLQARFARRYCQDRSCLPSFHLLAEAE